MMTLKTFFHIFCNLVICLATIYGQENVTCAQSGVCEYHVAQHFEQTLSKAVYWGRPVRDVTKPVPISFAFYLRNIIEVLEREQKILLTGYIWMVWNDEFHQWNHIWPLSCIDAIVLIPGVATSVWIPTIAFSSSLVYFYI